MAPILFDLVGAIGMSTDVKAGILVLYSTQSHAFHGKHKMLDNYQYVSLSSLVIAVSHLQENYSEKFYDLGLGKGLVASSLFVISPKAQRCGG